jgi:septal ring factor EnvC (AmiA/AmiB activator)
MAGEKAFKDVLDYVIKSNLNFSILQTPFSAQLSLKKSFVKKYVESSDGKLDEVKDDRVHDANETKLKELEQRLTIVNLENMKLQENIKENSNLISDLDHKCKVLETDLKAEKNEDVDVGDTKLFNLSRASWY